MKEWLQKYKQNIIGVIIFILMGLGMYIVISDIFNNVISNIDTIPSDLSSVGAPISVYGLVWIVTLIGILGIVIAIISTQIMVDGQKNV